MDHRAQTVPILHTGSVKSANQPSFSGAFRQVCRNCTGTLSLPPNDRQIPLPERRVQNRDRVWLVSVQGRSRNGTAVAQQNIG